MSTREVQIPLIGRSEPTRQHEMQQSTSLPHFDTERFKPQELHGTEAGPWNAHVTEVMCRAGTT